MPKFIPCGKNNLNKLLLSQVYAVWVTSVSIELNNIFLPLIWVQLTSVKTCENIKMGLLERYGKVVYVISKINGLMPIAYDNDRSQFSASLPSAIYSFMFSIILIVWLLYLEIRAITFYIVASSAFYFELISATVELLLNFLKTLIIYTNLMFNKKRLVYVLNNGIYLIKEISRLLDDGDQFTDTKCRQQILNRILFVTIQGLSIAAVCSVTVYIHSQFTTWILICYTHVYTVLITGVIYFSGMVVTARLYRILHQALKSSFRLLKKSPTLSNHQINAISDSIYRIACNYHHVTVFANRLNSLFGIHLLMTLITSYAFVFNSASWFFFCMAPTIIKVWFVERLTLVCNFPLSALCYAKYFRLQLADKFIVETACIRLIYCAKVKWFELQSENTQYSRIYLWCSNHTALCNWIFKYRTRCWIGYKRGKFLLLLRTGSVQSVLVLAT